jgi:hypothetical protein
MRESTCSIPGCDRKHYGRGWCRRHWKKWRRNGDPLAGRWEYLPTIEQRFWQKVEKTDTCWWWRGALTPQDGGHFRGAFRVNGRLQKAHRVAYELVVGPIPDGLQIDHLCRNPQCVNPAHLEPVTGAENTRRADPNAPRRAATHCQRGHPFDEANTYRRPDGSRTCLACKEMRRGRVSKHYGGADEIPVGS